MENKKKSFLFMCILVICIIFLVFKFQNNNEKPNQKQRKVQDGVGVSIHRDMTENDVKNMANAGLQWVRISVRWQDIENRKGEYDFETEGYDNINKWIKKYNLKPYYVLNYSNSLYEKHRSITTKEGRQAFARFVSVTVKHYKNQNGVWEIWNEPNITKFWNPQPSYESYVNLVEKVAPIIRKEDPNSLIVGPAISRTYPGSLKWLDQAFNYNLLNYIDAVSVHPYRDAPPETVIADYQKIRSMIKSHTDRQIQLFSGEWGYSMAPKPNKKISEMKQAEYFTRMMLTNKSENIDLSIWYDWKNDGYNQSEIEHNFGIVWRSGNPKLTYLASQTLTANLKGYKFVKRYNLKNKDDYLLEFSNKNEKKAIVYWTKGSHHNSTVPLESGSGKAISMLGAEYKIEWKKGTDFSFSTSPTYVFID